MIRLFAIASAVALRVLPAEAASQGDRDVTQMLQSRLDAGERVFLPAGTYVVTNTIALRKGASVSGVRGRTRIVMKGDGEVFRSAGRLEGGRLVRASGFEFRNLVMVAGAASRNRHAIRLDSVENVLLEHVETIGMGGLYVGTVYKVNAWDRTPDPPGTAGMVGDESLSSNIVVRSCRFDGGRPDYGGRGLYIGFATDCEVRDCTATNVFHGFQFWGGDSFHERGGLLENDKRCKRIVIADSSAVNVQGGGIWGSMVEDWSVTNCMVRLSSDVGIDFEGCHRAEAVDCFVSDCKNGNLATFMYCLGDVAFRRCRSVLTANHPFPCHYFNSNSTLRAARQRVMIEGCTFSSDRQSCVRVQSALAEFRFVDNVLENVHLDTKAANMGRVVVEKTRILPVASGSTDGGQLVFEMYAH